MSDTELALVAAVNAAPGDDTPRLVFADWLDENGGEARAEFIRVQVRLAALKSGLDEGYGGRGVKGRGVNAIKALRRRERELLDRHEHEWCVWWGYTFPIKFPSYRTVNASHTPGGQVFRRGFVAELSLDWEEWLEHADAIYWLPGLTVVCPECKNYPRRVPWTTHRVRCGVCRNTGRVPRPCPPTAQPVERVALTTWPTSEWLTKGGPEDWRDRSQRPVGYVGTLGSEVCLRHLAARWPGVEFTLPTNPPS